MSKYFPKPKPIGEKCESWKMQQVLIYRILLRRFN